MNRTPAIEFVCQQCNAARGARCRTNNGYGRVTRWHRQRVAAAQREDLRRSAVASRDSAPSDHAGGAAVSETQLTVGQAAQPSRECTAREMP